MKTSLLPLLLAAALAPAHAAEPRNIAPDAFVVAHNMPGAGFGVAPQDNAAHPTRGAVDGVIAGHPGNPKAEWATKGVTVEASLCLRWTKPVRLVKVRLFDRPNPDDQILAGELITDSGKVYPVGPLENSGKAATEVTLDAAPVKTLTFRVTKVSASTKNAGLAEFEALSPDPAPPRPEAILPRVIYDENPGFVELHDLAWKQAMAHIRYRPGLAQPLYMDEACWDNTLWIWDTCFMALYCRYAADIFPGVESLENFYAPILDGTKSSLRIETLDNPPLYAWAEYDHLVFTGDKSRAKRVFTGKRYLQRQFEWRETVKRGVKLPNVDHHPVRWQREPLGYLWETGYTGMDNTPRGRDHGQRNILWVDAIAQQGLSALYISRMAERLGDARAAAEWKGKYEALRKLVNERYWDKDDKFYYDIDSKTGAHSKVQTVASFWPMFAEMATPGQAAALVAAFRNPNKFGGGAPFPSLARDDKDFAGGERRGDYWRGGVWLPTVYMGVKALEKYGYHDDARAASVTMLHRMLATYRNFSPATIWECYDPDSDRPSTEHGRTARPDFCGWSALGPISLLIENVIGIQTVDAQKRAVRWRLVSKDRCGVANLHIFGDTVTDLVAEKDGTLRIRSDRPYTLEVNGKVFGIRPGEQTFRRP